MQKDDKKALFNSFGFKIFLLMILTIVTASAVTYGFFATEKKQSGLSSLETSCFNVTFTDQNPIHLTNAYSMSDDKGQTTAPYTFTITNTCDIEAAYVVLINTKTGSFSGNYINYSMNKGPATKLSLKENTKDIPSGYDKSYIVQEGTLKKGESATYDVRLWINSETSFEDVQGKSFEGQVQVVSTVAELGPQPLLSTIMEKKNEDTVTEYTAGTTGEMYTFDHDAATQTTGWSETERRDYRYIGLTPNNWVKFNGEDWRIIGVFTAENSAGTKEQLVKIIRNESIGDIPWDDYTDGTVTNEWPNSSLKTLLNGDYYNTESSFNYSYKRTSSSTVTTITIPNGLNAEAQSQIEEVKWYLGGSSTYENLGGPAYYNFEREETTCATTRSCSGQTRSTNTIAKVGLMYPSDYVYTYGNRVDSTCYTDGYNCDTGAPENGWIFNSTTQWTVSPNAHNSDYAFIVYSNGSLDGYYDYISGSYGIRPSVYLKSSVKITGGDGSSENPYHLSGK